MKHLLFFSRDPGGTNVLLPLILEMRKEFIVEVWGKDTAIGRFRQSGIDCSDITDEISEITEKRICEWLNNKKPDAIITGTSADDNTEKFLWMASKQLNTPSVAILDQWLNYGIRFSPHWLCAAKDWDFTGHRMIQYLPDYIFTMDEPSKAQLMKEGIPEHKIKVTGHPYLEFFKKYVLDIITDSEVASYRKKIGADEDSALFVFASEDISKAYGDSDSSYYWGYNEKTIFKILKEALLEAKSAGQDVILLIRPHPKEESNYWNRIINTTPDLNIKLDTTSSSAQIIRSADLIIGMQSMFLLEAVIAGANVMSVQIGLNREDPFILTNTNVMKPIKDYKQLVLQLRSILNGERLITDWHIGDGSIENCIQVIKEELWHT